MSPTNYIFSLIKIDLLEKSMDWEICESKQDGEFDCQFGMEISITTDENISNHRIKVNVIQGEGRVIATLTVTCTFSIPNLDQYKNSDGKLIIPNDFILLLNTVTIGTARGMMFSEFRGTFLHDAILPVIDPSQLQPKSE
jgi:hypothetical protein